MFLTVSQFSKNKTDNGTGKGGGMAQMVACPPMEPKVGG
jgi:hypothetical protein